MTIEVGKIIPSKTVCVSRNNRTIVKRHTRPQLCTFEITVRQTVRKIHLRKIKQTNVNTVQIVIKIHDWQGHLSINGIMRSTTDANETPNHATK